MSQLRAAASSKWLEKDFGFVVLAVPRSSVYFSKLNSGTGYTGYKVYSKHQNYLLICNIILLIGTKFLHMRDMRVFLNCSVKPADCISGRSYYFNLA